MKSLLTADEEDEETEQPEINLSAASLLGLFAGLVLICGVFFGLGYSVGRRAAPASAILSNPLNPAVRGAGSNSAKQSATPAGDAQDAANNSSLPISGDAPIPVSADASSQTAQSAPVDLPIVETPPPELRPGTNVPIEKPSAQTRPLVKPEAIPAAATPVSTPAPATAAPATAAPAPAGEAMVQVAAVAHQEDADVLVSALRQRGYSAVVRNEPQDKLLHVQIGPYATRAEAMAMRQKLLSDGYNAIIKQ